MRFAFDDRFVGNEGPMAFKQGKPEMPPAVVQAPILDDPLQLGVAVLSG